MFNMRTVIPNARKDLLNDVLCLHLEMVHCVQDDEISGFKDE
ncbi:hypothetical protein [Legionella quateirensis]|nr:hypothetical protein [Legionella quateirensis]